MMTGRAAEIVICPFGILAFEEGGEMVRHVKFPRDVKATAKKLVSLMDGRPVKELRGLIKALRGQGYDTFLFENPDLARSVEEELGVETSVRTPLRAAELVRSDMAGFAEKIGFSEPGENIDAWIHDVSMEMTRSLVRRSLEKRDLVVAQAINMIDDIDRILNLMASRIREWYNIHFPELNRLVEDHERFIRLVRELGHRDNFTVEKLRKLGLPREKAEEILRSLGISNYNIPG